MPALMPPRSTSSKCPVDRADFARSACQIPVAAIAAEARLFGARHDDVRRNPVFAVADHDVLAGLFAAHRRDDAFRVVLDLDLPGLAFGLVADRYLPNTEKLPDQNRQKVRRAAHASGEDPCQRLHGLRRRLVVDEQCRGPIAARHDARQVHHDAGIDAAEIDIVEMPAVETKARPGLAAVFGRRMIAEREHAGTEHRATARQGHFAFQIPRFSQVKLPSKSGPRRPAPRRKRG